MVSLENLVLLKLATLESLLSLATQIREINTNEC
jgi:hypothetical protein